MALNINSLLSEVLFDEYHKANTLVNILVIFEYLDAIAQKMNTRLFNCTQAAYEVIKHRQESMVDGLFIKNN